MKKKTNREVEREVWKVEMKSRDDQFTRDEYEYFVFATSVAQAEKRGLELANIEKDFPDPYCASAAFAHYVY